MTATNNTGYQDRTVIGTPDELANVLANLTRRNLLLGTSQPRPLPGDPTRHIIRIRIRTTTGTLPVPRVKPAPPAAQPATRPAPLARPTPVYRPTPANRAGVATRPAVTVRAATTQRPVARNRPAHQSQTRQWVATILLILVGLTLAAVAVTALIHLILAHLPAVVGLALIAGLVSVLLGRAGVCPGIHCPGCRHR